MFADPDCIFRKLRAGEDGRDMPGHDGVGESIISALGITAYRTLYHLSDRRLLDEGREGIELKVARAHCTNSSTAGASVRFFNVTSTTGHGRLGRSIGKILSRDGLVLRFSIEPGSADTKRPVASN